MIRMLSWLWPVGCLLFFPSLLACSRTGNTPVRPFVAVPLPIDTLPLVNANPLRYLALGDSYTIGQSVPEADRYPVQAATMLQQMGKNAGSPDIIARTGWTTRDLLAGLDAASLAPEYDFVSLLIGVNNQYQGSSIEQYRVELQQLVQFAVQRAKGRKERVVVLSIPDYSVTPFARYLQPWRIAADIDRFNATKSSVCSQAGVTYIDVTPISREAAADASLIAADSLHFSGKMYFRFAERLVQTLLPRLP